MLRAGVGCRFTVNCQVSDQQDAGLRQYLQSSVNLNKGIQPVLGDRASLVHAPHPPENHHCCPVVQQYGLSGLATGLAMLQEFREHHKHKQLLYAPVRSLALQQPLFRLHKTLR